MFEFDPAKSAAKAEKHGIDFKVAQALWKDEDLIELSARRGEFDEERRLAIGDWPDRRTILDGRIYRARPGRAADFGPTVT